MFHLVINSLVALSCCDNDKGVYSSEISLTKYRLLFKDMCDGLEVIHFYMDSVRYFLSHRML